jgi:thymidylate synthase
MVEIIAQTLSEAHEAAFDAILECHKEIDIQTHVDKKEFTLELEGPNGSDDFMVIKVLHPLQEPQISAGSNFGPKFTEAYKKQFLTLTPPREDGNGAVYTYWNRSEDFPILGLRFDLLGRVCGTFQKGNGRGDGYKQISKLIEKLSADPNSRRGVIITWSPELDAESREPPCMDLLQFVIRNGKLNGRLVFRSQDMLLGLPENLVGGAAMLEYIANALGVPVGQLTIVSLIPHIYKKRDESDFDKLRAYIFEKKTFGKWTVEIKW